MRLIHNLPESQVVKIWQHVLSTGTELTTEGSEPIKVIYPGRLNDDGGADFRDAVIATNQRSVKGDIEVHVKSSDWQAHQHHRNPVYNRVVLHVVMWDNTKSATNLQNGKGIPTLALDKFIKSPLSQQPDLSLPGLSTPCSKTPDRPTASGITEFLDTAGEERFLAKATWFRADLAQTKANQTLYQGIMGALGYSKNKIPMLKLAHRLPLQILESMTQDKIPDEECLARQQALLLGTAGLLPSQRPNWHQEFDDRWIAKLEKLWASSPQTNTLPTNAWHLFKVRPNNFPVRRIVAMSYLILRYRKKGILAGIINMIKEAPLSEGHCRLEKGVLVITNDYWASHFDFGSGSQTENPTLLGKSRADDIVVNVILPFTFAWSQLTSRPELMSKALNLYHSYPKLESNAVERHMSNQLGLSSSQVNSARRQQGLLHIYNTLCTQGKCNFCRLSYLKKASLLKCQRSPAILQQLRHY